MKVTPLHILFAILHSRGCPERTDTSAVDDLVRANLIEPDSTSSSGYKGTPGLDMYVEALKRVPLPRLVSQWAMEPAHSHPQHPDPNIGRPR